MKKILAISGSLRANSSNDRLLIAASRLDVPGIEIHPHKRLANLPYFNPDLDTDHPPAEVQKFRAEIGAADGLLISSPEYAHGVPGALKNALDWLVASTEFPGKPVVLICGGEFAPAQLEETLKTMSANVLRNFVVAGPVLRKAFAQNGDFADEAFADTVRDCLELF